MNYIMKYVESKTGRRRSGGITEEILCISTRHVSIIVWKWRMVVYEYHSITAYHGKPTCCFHTVRDSDDRNGRSQLRYSESRAATGCEGNNGLGLGDLSYLRWRTREKGLDKREREKEKIHGVWTVRKMEDKRKRVEWEGKDTRCTNSGRHGGQNRECWMRGERRINRRR